MPIAVIMDLYSRYLRPGRIGEILVIGFTLLIAAILIGDPISRSPTFAPMFTFSGETIAVSLMAYGFIASMIPVWLLLARATTC